MEPSPPAVQESRSMPNATTEIEITSGPSRLPPTTDTQLVVLLSESRLEAISLRRELAALRKKSDEDQRRLRNLSVKSPDPQVRVFQDRLARAEAALEDAEARNRFVERNWLQVERYLMIIQQQAADSRVAFSRLMEENDGRLVLPNDSQSIRRRDIPLGDYVSSSGSAYRPSNLHRNLPSSPEFMRPPPLTTPRRPLSPPSRSPSGVEGGQRWHADDRGDRSPPHKKLRVSGRSGEFRPRSSRSPPPPPRSPVYPSHSATSAPRHKPDPERVRYPSREYMPPPPAPPRPDPYRPSETLRTYDARNPPLQFIPHRHPPVPPRPPTPPAPPPPAQTFDAGGPHQYQHRFPLNRGVFGPRRLLRPGAYETMVFALDSDAPPQEVGRAEEE
ncbi:hypothetical protein C8R45DRAFT_1017993 [Mycena sanguinolenta]|nr:hypothetical protein C8R45DRAFT_1017993 [Mycena sanguinolenta]